jgi:hypothetical protein
MLDVKTEPRINNLPAEAYKLGALPEDGIVNAKTCWSKV